LPGSQVGPDLILPGGKLLRIYQERSAGGCHSVAVEHNEVRWLAADELDDVDWLPADRILLPTLHRLVRGCSEGHLRCVDAVKATFAAWDAVKATFAALTR